MREWFDEKGLLDPARLGAPSPLPRQAMPTLAHAMRAISTLLAASRLPGEPIYIFSDDAKDYFNQLVRMLIAIHEVVNVKFDVDGVVKALLSIIGVKQGDLLGPELFDFYIAAIWRLGD